MGGESAGLADMHTRDNVFLVVLCHSRSFFPGSGFMYADGSIRFVWTRYPTRSSVMTGGTHGEWCEVLALFRVVVPAMFMCIILKVSFQLKSISREDTLPGDVSFHRKRQVCISDCGGYLSTECCREASSEKINDIKKNVRIRSQIEVKFLAMPTKPCGESGQSVTYQRTICADTVQQVPAGPA